MTITGHGMETGFAVYYEKFEDGIVVPGLVDTTIYYVRVVDANTFELYDTYANATAATSVTQGIRDITGVGTAGKYHRFQYELCNARV